MPGYNSQKQDTACTLPKLIVLFYVFFVCKCVLYYCYRGHAVAQLVEALRYKPEGHGFDSPMVSLEIFH